jgi:cephalosporin hydroxylase
MLIGSLLKKAIIKQFNRIYYDTNIFEDDTYWLGVSTLKCPLDLWVYQEILHELKPDVIIETGTHLGGSALYLASICDLLQKGKVITIDIRKRSRQPHHRIEYLEGSSVSPEIIAEVRRKISAGDKVMAILDSDHKRDHVLKEMVAYGPLVTKGSYLIVEDTNVNGHPSLPDFGPGPWEAVEAFLASNREFKVDRRREKFMVTFNPSGYLKKIA